MAPARWIRAAVAAIAIACPTLASAGDPKSEAQTHIDRATTRYNERRYDEALDDLKTAYALDPRPELLFAIAQIHVSLGQCPKAITFYERFLATSPTADAAAATTEAIETCKTNPPGPIEAPADPPGTKPDVKPAPAPAPSLRDTASPIAIQRTAPRPWYADPIADGLVLGGVVSSVIGIMLYRSALDDRDRADPVMNYAEYTNLLDSAQRSRRYAVGFSLAGVALIGGGVVRHLVTRGETVRVVPIAGGGAVTWSGRF